MKIESRLMRKLLLLLSLVLTACDRVCESSINLENGDYEVINKQCLRIADKEVLFVKIKDKTSGCIKEYTANIINGHIIFNINTKDAIALEKAEEAQNASNAAMAASVAASTAAMSVRGK